jgi:serine/threonine protein phosphatase 1
VWKPSSAAKPLGKASLPDGVRIYAIGDLHGRTDLLQRQLAQIDSDEGLYPCGRSIIVCLGDYIDRGPDSCGTINALLDLARHRELVCLKGNHETLILRFLDRPASLDDWRLLGGLETLVSYGLRPSFSRSNGDNERLSEQLRDALPQQHLDFLNKLPSSFSCGDFLFVHAGVRPGVALGRQVEDDMLWIRDEFLQHEAPFEKFVVHGHTPVSAPDIRSNRANIDTGAFATGRLSCIAIEGRHVLPLRDLRAWMPGGNTRGNEMPRAYRDGLEASPQRDLARDAPQGVLPQIALHQSGLRSLGPD